jgi:LysR family transcriptional activator of mexEF-oprN operon
LKIQQPAMSHNLATLRLLLQDELFVRVGQIMQPTVKAQALSGPIRMALDQAQSALNARASFDPKTETRTFRLGLSSEIELLLLPDLTARLQKSAPNIKILSRVARPDQVEAMLDIQAIDLAVGCSYHNASRFLSDVMFDAQVMCCFNPRILKLEVPVKRETYLAMRHAVVSQTESLHGCVKEALEHAGVELDVVTAAPDFLSVLATAIHAPVLATVAARVAQKYGPMLGLTTSSVPLDLKFPPVTMVWSLYADKDPGNAWIRQQIRESFEAVPGIG